MKVKVGAALAAMTVAMLVGVAPAGAVPVKPAACGTITGHVELDADLTCSEVHVEARAVVDLAGHTLTGTHVTVGRATIRDGMLACDGGSITVTGSRFTRAGVEGLRCSMTITGNRLAGSPGLNGVTEVLAVDLPVQIDSNQISGYAVGVNAVGVTNTDPRDLTDLTLTGNRLHSNRIGAEVNCGGACLIDSNQISRNHHGVIGYGSGVYTVTNNVVRFNEDLPVSIAGTVVASGNRVYGNGRPCQPSAC